MTQIPLPDGTVANFPDDMPIDAMNAAIQAHLNQPQQMQGEGRMPAMLGSAGLKGVVEGLGGMADTMAAPITNVVKSAAGAFAPQPYAQAAQQASVSQGLLSPLRAAGAVDRPDLIPQTPGERYATAGVEGAGQAVPMMLGGGAGWGGRLQALMQGVGGGLGSQAATDLTQPVPGQQPDLMQRIGQRVAPMIGNIAGSLGAGGVYGAGNKAVGMATGASTPVMRAYDNLNITPTMAGDVSGNPFLRQLQMTFGHLPGGFGPMADRAHEALNQWGQALESTAAQLGRSRTQQAAGEAAQFGAGNWLDQFRNQSDANWANVSMHIPASAPAPMSNLQAALAHARTTIPDLPGAASVLEEQFVNDLDARLRGDLTVPARNTGVLDAQGNPIITPSSQRTTTWQNLNGVRQLIGQRMADPMTYNSPSEAVLRRLYAAASNDAEAVATSQGPQAEAAFNNARDYTREGHDFIDTTLSKITRGNTISPQQAASNILNTTSGGGTMLDRIRQQMPQVADELAAYKLRDMGLATAGQQDAAGTRLSPGSFVTDAANLSPEATRALFGTYPDVSQRVDDLRTVAGSMKDTQRFGNTSGTTPMAKAAEAFSIPAMIEAARQGYEIGRVPGAIMGAMAPFAPGMIGSRLMTMPGVNRYMANPGAGGSWPATGLAALGAMQYPPGLLQ